jgi:hypothetical protein
LYRRHGSLRKELNVKTPFDAVLKWYKINPEILEQNPFDFRNKIISLNKQVINFNQQPYET